MNIVIRKCAYAYIFVFYLFSVTSAWIQYPADGFATMTHYTMPSDYVASCGCTGESRYDSNFINVFQASQVLTLSQQIPNSCHESNGLWQLHVLWPSLWKVLQAYIVEHISVGPSVLSTWIQVSCY